MRLNTLTFKDQEEEWELDRLEFFDLTLLVGISGVGKTQILRAIMQLKRIARGEPSNGVEWDISFSNEDRQYTWKGKYEEIESLSSRFDLMEDEEDQPKPKLMYESVLQDGEMICERRETGEIFFENKPIPKLSSEESLVNLFKEEERVAPIYHGFQKITLRDHTQKIGLRFHFRVNDLKKLRGKYHAIEEIKASDLDTVLKLYLIYEDHKDVFAELKDDFIQAFPQVEGVKVEPLKDEELPVFLSETPILSIKEKDVERWIPQNRISSGMLRTFLHLSEMLLLPEGTVVLIDEFENSLGVNCIDVLTEDLVYENRRIQFIATSHHPYIINQIPYENWKIVTRKGGIIHTRNASEYDLGESRHDRFLNLINLPAYKEGIS